MRLAVSTLLAVLVCASPPARAQQIGAWSIAPYGEARPTLGPEGIDLRVAAPPAAGLVLKTAVEPKQRYELLLRGHKISGAPSLRVRLDDEEPEYLAAPDGTAKVIVGGWRMLEVMIYGETAFEYRLRDIALKPCVNCVTSKEMRTTLQTLGSGWAAELLGTPTVRQETGGVLLEGSGAGENGAFLRNGGVEAENRRLMIRGRRISGNPSLRLKIGSEEPRWLPVPDGTVEWAIPAGSAIEVLVYSPEPFQYRLESVELAKQ